MSRETQKEFQIGNVKGYVGRSNSAGNIVMELHCTAPERKAVQTLIQAELIHAGIRGGLVESPEGASGHDVATFTLQPKQKIGPTLTVEPSYENVTDIIKNLAAACPDQKAVISRLNDIQAAAHAGNNRYFSV